MRLEPASVEDIEALRRSPPTDAFELRLVELTRAVRSLGVERRTTTAEGRRTFVLAEDPEAS